MNKQLILIKYASEIFLKGLNRGRFEKKLLDNIKRNLEGLSYEIINDQGRYFISCDNIDEAIKQVKKVFGVAELCIVTEVERELSVIKEEALRRVREIKPKSFKIETNRANKKFPLN